MKLGNAAEVSLSVGDAEAGARYFERLGFERTSPIDLPYACAAVTDGVLTVGLHEAPFPSPSLIYYGAPLAELQSAFATIGIEAPVLRRAGGEATIRRLVTPCGLRLVLARRPAPERTPAANAASRCGVLAELTLPTADRDASAAFWASFGFVPQIAYEQPYPWGALSDDIFRLGLHETTDFNAPALTFFAEDAPARIGALRRDGFTISRAADGDRHAVLEAPGGLLLFLFKSTPPS